MSEQTTSGVPAQDGQDFAAFRAARLTGSSGAPEGAESAAESETAEEVTEQPETGDEETAAGAAEESETEPDPPEKKKKKGGFQKRIDELTADKRKLAEEVERLRILAEKPAAETKPAAAAANVSDAEPNEDDFESFAEYTKALVRWERDQERKAERAEAQKREAAEKAKSLTDKYTEREAAIKAELPDYDEVMAEAADIGVSPALAEALLESDIGPRIAYHLARNPAEAQRLNALNALQAAREIGKLEATLTSSSSSGAPKQKPLSKAPTPIKPITASKPVATNNIADAALADDFDAWRKVRARMRS